MVFGEVDRICRRWTVHMGESVVRGDGAVGVRICLGKGSRRRRRPYSKVIFKKNQCVWFL